MREFVLFRVPDQLVCEGSLLDCVLYLLNRCDLATLQQLKLDGISEIQREKLAEMDRAEGDDDAEEPTPLEVVVPMEVVQEK